MNMEIPEIRKARMIDTRRLEVFWSQAVVNSQYSENIGVYHKGRRIATYERSDDEEWDRGTVYEEGKRKTTYFMNEEIDCTHMEEYSIQVLKNIRSTRTYRVFPSRSTQRPPTITYRAILYKIHTTCALRCLCINTVNSRVSEEAHAMAKTIVDFMLLKLPEASAILKGAGAELAIYAKDEDAYEIPEHRAGCLFLHRPVEGFGGTMEIPTTSISEVNVLHILEGEHITRYTHECILVHEFAHAVHLIGINYMKDTSLADECRAIYATAKEEGLWPHTYAISNYEEYFATLSTVWFNVMEEGKDGTWDGTRGPVNTRAELKEYDQRAYAFFGKIYSSQYLPAPWDTYEDAYDIHGNRR
ncbi:MAG: hypothetical protein ACLTDX_13910 [[Clostridium] innocuum]